MVDTNVLSEIARGRNSQLDARFADQNAHEICVSVITEGEVLFGLAKNPEAIRNSSLMLAMLSRFEVLDWTSQTAAVYGHLRANMRRLGKALEPLDMLIAAHALEAGATLITSDRAFLHVPGLSVEDWTAA